VTTVVVMLLILLAALAYYYFTQIEDEPSLGPSPGPSPGSTLTITENGASLSEGYRMMPKRESYFMIPAVNTCGTDSAEDYCSAYETVDTNGFAYVYDLSLGEIESSEYTECPGGGHDCWFIEKYDSEGTLINVVNKEGVNMVNKVADDIWADRWSVDSPMVVEMTKNVEFKDGTLKSKGEMSAFNGERLQAGDTIKPMHVPAAGYFVGLFVAMKTAGIEKPSNIVLNVKNAKDAFDNEKSRYPSESS